MVRAPKDGGQMPSIAAARGFCARKFAALSQEKQLRAATEFDRQSLKAANWFYSLVNDWTAYAALASTLLHLAVVELAVFYQALSHLTTS